MASRSLNDLLPVVREKAHRFTSECEKQGIELLVYCTYRSSDEQTALYVQGREPLPVVNTLRERAGLPPITDSANRIATKARAGSSYHEYRCAFDCVPLEAGKPVWDDKHPLWQKIGEIGKSCGLEWAGDWKTFKEFPHFQYTGGLSLADMKAGKVPV